MNVRELDPAFADIHYQMHWKRFFGKIMAHKMIHIIYICYKGRSGEIWQDKICNYFFIPYPFWMFYAFYIVSLPFVEIISSFETKSIFFVKVESTNRSYSWIWFRIEIFKMGRLPWLNDTIIGASNSYDLLNLKRNLLELKYSR